MEDTARQDDRLERFFEESFRRIGASDLAAAMARLAAQQRERAAEERAHD
jgi:hypothetical protein